METIIVDKPYEHNNCYVIRCSKANITSITSDRDLASHIVDYLTKQHGEAETFEYCDVDVTYFIAGENTSLAHKVEDFVNELQSSRQKLER